MVLAVLFLTTNIIKADTPKQWTLKECIDYALSNNIQLKQNKLSKLESTEDVKAAKAKLFPSLSFSTSHQLGYRPYPNEGQSTVTNGYVEAIDKTSYNGSYGLNANWTVWNGGKNTNTVKQQKLAEQQADLTTEETANSIQEKIAQLYIEILYSTEAIKVNQQTLEISRQNAKRGEDMVKVGKLAKADLAQLNAQVASDQYDVVNTQSQLANYKLQLKQLLEITGDTSFDVSIPETSDSQALSEIPTVSEVFVAALDTRPEIKNTKIGIQSSDLDIAIAKSGYLPSLSVTGSVGASTSSGSDLNWSRQMKNNLNGSVGISVSVPILDNRSTKTAVNKAKYARENQSLELQNKQKNLYSTIEGFWLDANTNQQKFKSAIVSTESAQTSYELVSEQFRLGLKNIVELTTGKNNLLTAEQNKLQSKYTTILNQQMLKFYKGESMNL